MEDEKNHSKNPLMVFLIFLRLGFTSFGGPIAHLGYFRDEFVIRRGWLTEETYADLVALCQFLPGPASSQVGLSIGLMRAGYSGALAAWSGFTLPSAAALILFALGMSNYGEMIPGGVLHGLKIAAVAVVAQAVWGMGRKLLTDLRRVTLMALACCAVLFFPSAPGQVAVIVLSALAGLVLFEPMSPVTGATSTHVKKSTGAAVFFLVLFFALLAGLPVLARLFPIHSIAMADTFFRVGSLVFGGGHVVLPLLQAEVVPSGWVSGEAFLAGYGAAQAVPGPLFTFASFLGASMSLEPNAVLGGLLCLAAIFAPSFLLVFGVLPFWDSIRRNRRIRSMLSGVNAAVVGLLLAALYQPVWTSAVLKAQDFALALLAFVALLFWKLPSWVVVFATGATSGLLHLTSPGVIP